MTVQDPNWSVLEEKAWEKYVDGMPSSEKKTHYVGQISDVKRANKDLIEDGISGAELRIGPFVDFTIRPARPFYENNPECKFAYGDTFQQPTNRFETAESAKNAIYALSLPQITYIERGWGQTRSQPVTERCNKKWHGMVAREVRRNVSSIIQREVDAQV